MCSRCKKNPRTKSHRWCLVCKRAAMKVWRRSHPLSPEQRRKMNARSYAHVYLKRGWFIRRPCRKCGSEKAQMHHPDYSRPLWVVWLCRPCHLDEHTNLTKS